MITYPQFYKGGYPDVEVLVETLFTPLLSGVTPVHWWPSDQAIVDALDGGDGYLSIYRTGGRINYEQNRDEPNVQFVALTKSRDASWGLIEFVRQILFAYFKAAGTITVQGVPHKFQLAAEILGPQLTRAEIRDERIVPATFTLYTWKPGGLGNYREALDGL